VAAVVGYFQELLAQVDQAVVVTEEPTLVVPWPEPLIPVPAAEVLVTEQVTPALVAAVRLLFV
jgi:hypothetical protein